MSFFPLGPVAELADIISGFAFKSPWFGHGYDKVIRISDIQDGVINLDSAVTFDASANRVSDQYRIRKGDILMALSGATTGKIGIADECAEGAYLNQRVAIIRGKDEISSKYLKYVFKGRYLDKLLLAAGGAAQANLSPKVLAALEIPLPPLAEQKRIAAILDKADALRRKRLRAIELADQFLRSVFLDMFGDPVTNPKGWPLESLTDFGQFKNGLNYSKSESGHNVYCIGVGDFKAFDRLVGVDALSSIQLDELPDEGYLLEDGDLLFVRSNGNKALVGRCLTVHPNENNVTFSGFCIRYRPADRDQLNSDYLNYCMRMPSMKNAMLKGGQGANIQNISQKTLSSLLIPLPPAELQRKFAHVVQNFRAAQEKAHKAFEKGNDLFNSLSQQAFAGTP
ncbi:restriction endonuclease subunit S [bacterium 19NY03SH02]|uniref:Restriction endonuclease subunit S n=2 Tax=Unclassified Bacteria TaxID=49928 RepID=A0AAU6VU20_UNCXX